MSEYHEAIFRWPHPGASDVIVTGEFDGWTGSTHLPRKGALFEGPVKVPWGQTIQYKYIVDGKWTTTDDHPTTYDHIGNLNNVYTSPERPPAPKLEGPPPSEAAAAPAPESKPATLSAVTNAIETAISAATTTAVGMADAIAPDVASHPDTPAETDKGGLEAKTVEEPEAVATTPAEPAAVPAPPEPEPEATELATEAVLPASREQLPTASAVPVAIMPVTADAPTNGDAVHTAVAEEQATTSKPLETTVVEGSTAAADVVPAATPPAAEVPSTHIVMSPVGETKTEPAPTEAASETPAVDVEDSTTAADAVPSDAVPSASAPAAEEQSTHIVMPPVGENKTEATPAEAAPETPAVNGTTTNGADKPATNGTSAAPDQTPTSSPAPSSPTTPHKEKRMRFPSFGSHSRHSSTSASEFGEQGSPKDGHAARLGSTQRRKRNSIFGKIKDIFVHDVEHKK